MSKIFYSAYVIFTYVNGNRWSLSNLILCLHQRALAICSQHCEFVLLLAMSYLMAISWFIFLNATHATYIPLLLVLSGALSKKHIDSGGDVQPTVETDCATLQRHYSCELFQKVRRYNGSTMLVRNELLLLVFDLSLEFLECTYSRSK